MEQKANISEFNMYCKCPFLWKNVFVNGNTVTKQVSYRDFVYKKDISGIDTIGVEDQIIKADAIKEVINTLGNRFTLDGIDFTKMEDSNNQLELNTSDGSLILPYPAMYESAFGKAIVCTVITSSVLESSNLNTLAHLQCLALKEKFKIIIRHIQPSALKMKRAETDEEFEARRAELIRKSKTGTSKAQKQLGETREEFFDRYKKAITVHYLSETIDEKLISSFENALLMKISCFFRDKNNPNCIAFNDCFCRYCDINTKGGCPCLMGISSQDKNQGYIVVK